MKQTSPTKPLTCPGCKKDVPDTRLHRTLGRKVWFWGTIKTLDREDLVQKRVHWACDTCLHSGKALIGHPEAQLYCDFEPYLAYVSYEKECETCHQAFVFSKEEQQHWYETLRFWVQSKPKQCPSCRREVREEKKLNTELSTLLMEKEKLTIQDMERLSEIYEEIQKPDKSKYYQSLVAKAKKKDSLQNDV